MSQGQFNRLEEAVFQILEVLREVVEDQTEQAQWIRTEIAPKVYQNESRINNIKCDIESHRKVIFDQYLYPPEEDNDD